MTIFSQRSRIRTLWPSVTITQLENKRASKNESLAISTLYLKSSNFLLSSKKSSNGEHCVYLSLTARVANLISPSLTHIVTRAHIVYVQEAAKWIAIRRDDGEYAKKGVFIRVEKNPLMAGAKESSLSFCCAEIRARDWFSLLSSSSFSQPRSAVCTIMYLSCNVLRLWLSQGGKRSLPDEKCSPNEQK